VKDDQMPAFLPDETRVAQVRLRTRDNEKVQNFYHEVLGLDLVRHGPGEVGLSGRSQAEPLIVLQEDKTAKQAVGVVTGLFHLAIRYPSREELARVGLRVMKSGYPVEGASDHLVSEALYLSDPEGNGVELYADRPRSSWVWRDGQVMMATRALDLDELLSRASKPADKTKVPAGPELGHIHLRVADLAQAERFYHDFLGLVVTTRAYDGALFFSAGGYHHHIATNTWGSPALAPSDGTGLIAYRMVVPVREILYCLKNRAPLVGVAAETVAGNGQTELLRLKDPNGNWLEVAVG
jgi:catechol 2,3-dioxygenase